MTTQNSAERQELAQLRAENRRLREDVEILKRRRLSSRRRPGELLSVHRGGEPVHETKIQMDKTAGGAGGARTHDRRIMRSTASCTMCAGCTDGTAYRTDGIRGAGIIR